MFSADRERYWRLLSHSIPEPGSPAGYAALAARYNLRVPLPSRLAAIAVRHHPESTPEWLMLTPRHAVEDTLRGHLEFALKWEGVSLGVLAALFRAVDPGEFTQMVRDTPTGAYARRIWFLYEWLTGDRLDMPDAGKVRAALAVDPDRQFAASTGPVSSRHRVRDNLPGSPRFCPLARRTRELERYVGLGLAERAREVIGRTHPDIIRRAAAFMLLQDSRASFGLEGERPSQHRAMRWGWAIGAAGQGALTPETLAGLQEGLIGDRRFVRLGLRTEGGWVGSRDRRTGAPIPEHISARHEDLPELIRGVVQYAASVEESGVDAVVSAAALSFGYVYIHPFEDGNGRIHRWLVHHVLARSGFNPPGLVFPVSVAMLDRLAEYRDVLASYSSRLLPLLDWRATARGNIQVLNETADHYRFFDATRHAEFLYRCVEQTVTRDLPAEVDYLERYDEFLARVQEEIADMPEGTLDLLAWFLRQNQGTLSRRARRREFRLLTVEEVERVETIYGECFAEEASGATDSDSRARLDPVVRPRRYRGARGRGTH
ncbi:MAG: Fic family protein [Gemmatimonadota bacterium]|nr:Fic family protein [Gemmatimonadota bacterium]MXX35269.1 Fic family protein [Gemmatimonadota bacterium]MYD15147.1 Fic family protein [Gemmatimonadota bacterium]